jgi:hypothetical protein
MNKIARCIQIGDGFGTVDGSSDPSPNIAPEFDSAGSPILDESGFPILWFWDNPTGAMGVTPPPAEDA